MRAHSSSQRSQSERPATEPAWRVRVRRGLRVQARDAAAGVVPARLGLEDPALGVQPARDLAVGAPSAPSAVRAASPVVPGVAAYRGPPGASDARGRVARAALVVPAPAGPDRGSRPGAPPRCRCRPGLPRPLRVPRPAPGPVPGVASPGAKPRPGPAASDPPRLRRSSARVARAPAGPGRIRAWRRRRPSPDADRAGPDRIACHRWRTPAPRATAEGPGEAPRSPPGGAPVARRAAAPSRRRARGELAHRVASPRSRRERRRTRHRDLATSRREPRTASDRRPPPPPAARRTRANPPSASRSRRTITESYVSSAFATRSTSGRGNPSAYPTSRTADRARYVTRLQTIPVCSGP